MHTTAIDVWRKTPASTARQSCEEAQDQGCCQGFATLALPFPCADCSISTPPQEEKCSIQEHASLLVLKRFIADAKARKEPLLPCRQVPGALEHMQRFKPQLLLALSPS